MPVWNLGRSLTAVVRLEQAGVHVTRDGELAHVSLRVTPRAVPESLPRNHGSAWDPDDVLVRGGTAQPKTGGPR